MALISEIKESELNQEVLKSEDFKIFFLKNWKIGKEILERVELAINKRPLLKLAIKVIITLGDKLEAKLAKEFIITV